MADGKKRYVKVTFEWGTDEGNGKLTPKNKSYTEWVSMEDIESSALQYVAIIPGMNLINTKAAEIGLIGNSVGTLTPEQQSYLENYLGQPLEPSK